MWGQVLSFSFLIFPGIRGTYQGLTATMMKQGSNQAMRFFVVESLKDQYRAGDPKKSVPKLLTGLFGAIAGAVSVLGNNPLDVIKTRMQVREEYCISTNNHNNTTYTVEKNQKTIKIYNSKNNVVNCM